MTNYQMLMEAHAGARIDRRFDSSNSYAYYFRLHLIQLQDDARIERTGMGRGFQVVEPASWNGVSHK